MAPRTQPTITQYQHTDKERANIPQSGLVTPTTDPDSGTKKQYHYDPHLDPQLQWAGKAEHTSFEVPTVSLHVHERIDPKTIIESVAAAHDDGGQTELFGQQRPLREAIEFYQHQEGWSNRMIAGDSLLIMNSLLEKEYMGSKVQMLYFDPPYGIKYGSNFQPFVHKRDVKDGEDKSLTAEPEMIKAFRDTWELGIHSWLTYMRDRLLLGRDLLTDSGSCFVQISDENVHLVRSIMDEIFGRENFVSLISFTTSSGFSTKTISRVGDYLVWYAKDKENIKYHKLFSFKSGLERGDDVYKNIELPNGDRRAMTAKECAGVTSLPNNCKIFRYGDLQSQGSATEDTPFEFEDATYRPRQNRHWTARYPDGMHNLKKARRLAISGNSLCYVRYIDDYPVQQITNMWSAQMAESNKSYVVQTSPKVIQRCMLMTTDPGDVVFDPTCGSGTTACVAEQWGRRWITCDTSRVSLTLAKQRLMTAHFDYYTLAQPQEGIGSGLKYKTVPHITLKSIAHNEAAPTETLYDQPECDNGKARVTGPFTVEAVPAPYVKSFDELEQAPSARTITDNSIIQSDRAHQLREWCDILRDSGVRTIKGDSIKFSRMEIKADTYYIHAEGETVPQKSVPQTVLVHFGPKYSPLGTRAVEEAWKEARFLQPDILLFCAFRFDPEATKNINKMSTMSGNTQLLTANMNDDMLTDDLRKKQSGGDSFWLVGQPDVTTHAQPNGHITVEVCGFDYYNPDPKEKKVESGGTKDIAMWMLDTDYNGRSLYPRQVFFPIANNKQNWDRLAKNLKAQIDHDKITAYHGTTSLPFVPGEQIAVKIIDTRGIESLRVLQKADYLPTETRMR